jgi:hypothetical protein
MAGDRTGPRKSRLAAALKENLKRRKAQSRAKAEPDAAPKANALGTAPQAGLENEPEPGPKTAPNRN